MTESENNNDFPQFEALLEQAAPFQLRRAMERLREGLFDPLGVKLISSGDTTLNHHYATQTKQLEEGKPAHLCVCGAYGQGKSHTLTYIRQRALDDNFVVSYMNLDPREVPFHNQQQVYRALMEKITFPDAGEDEGAAAFARIWRQHCTAVTDAAKNRYNALRKTEENRETAEVTPPKKRKRKKEKAAEERVEMESAILERIPDGVAHRFKSILTAMGQQTETVPHGKRHLKKHARFKPREFPWILNNAFLGKEIPVVQLRNAIRYRQVSFYKEQSLTCREDRDYLETIKGYGTLFQNMGYKGWVLLFDEAESILLSRILQRSKSYGLLHELLCPEKPIPGLFPVFAFTHDFFTQLKDEDFEKTRTIKPRKRRKKAEVGDADNVANAGNAGSDDNAGSDGDVVSDGDAGNDSRSGSAGNRNRDEDGSGSRSGNGNENDDAFSNLPEPREVKVFEKNYSAAWKDLHLYRLRDLTSREWHLLIRKLIRIHALAYRWEPDMEAMDKMIFSKLLEYTHAESRMKLKWIVHLLDLELQQRIVSDLGYE